MVVCWFANLVVNVFGFCFLLARILLIQLAHCCPNQNPSRNAKKTSEKSWCWESSLGKGEKQVIQEFVDPKKMDPIWIQIMIIMKTRMCK